MTFEVSLTFDMSVNVHPRGLKDLLSILKKLISRLWDWGQPVLIGLANQSGIVYLLL